MNSFCFPRMRSMQFLKTFPFAEATIVLDQNILDQTGVNFGMKNGLKIGRTEI